MQSDRNEISEQFAKLYKTYQTIEDSDKKIQLKPGLIPIKQKARLIPYHLKLYVENEKNKLIKFRHLEKIQKIDEDCFAFPVVITMKMDKSVKVALDSKKLNDDCTKLRPHIPNMEEVSSRISTDITRAPDKHLNISKNDLKYAYDRLKPSKETSKHCKLAVVGVNLNGYFRFKKGLTVYQIYR